MAAALWAGLGRVDREVRDAAAVLAVAGLATVIQNRIRLRRRLRAARHRGVE